MAFIHASRWSLIPTSPVQVSLMGRFIGLALKGPLNSLLQTSCSQPPCLSAGALAWLVEVPRKSLFIGHILFQQSFLLHISRLLSLSIPQSPISVSMLTAKPSPLAVCWATLGPCLPAQGPCTFGHRSPDSICWHTGICPQYFFFLLSLHR